MNWLGKRSRVLAVIGIVLFLLAIWARSYREVGGRPGHPILRPSMPFAVFVSWRIVMLAFGVTVIVFLWKRARTLALAFAGVNTLPFLVFVADLIAYFPRQMRFLILDGPVANPWIGTPYDIPIRMALILLRVAGLVLYIWVIVKLFRARAPLPALPAEALREEPRSAFRARTGTVLGTLGGVVTIALVMFFGLNARATIHSRMDYFDKHPTLNGMLTVQESLDSWAKENGGAYPYATEFDSDSSRFMKFLARDRVG